MDTIKVSNQVLEAIERVCYKRSRRGASIQNIIAYLDSLAIGTWKLNDGMKDGINELRAYWMSQRVSGDLVKVGGTKYDYSYTN